MQFLLKTNVGASEKGGVGWYQSKAHIHSVFVATITEGGSTYFFYGSEPLKLFWYVHGPHLSEGRRGGGKNGHYLRLFHCKITHVSKEIVFQSNGSSFVRRFGVFFVPSKGQTLFAPVMT